MGLTHYVSLSNLSFFVSWIALCNLSKDFNPSNSPCITIEYWWVNPSSFFFFASHCYHTCWPTFYSAQRPPNPLIFLITLTQIISVISLSLATSCSRNPHSLTSGSNNTSGNNDNTTDGFLHQWWLVVAILTISKVNSMRMSMLAFLTNGGSPTITVSLVAATKTPTIVAVASFTNDLTQP